MALTFNQYNISFSEKLILWTPPKTASTFLIFIFQHFDFYTVKSDPTFNFINEKNQNLKHIHDCEIPASNQYKVICSIRNPYDMILSGYYYHLDTENKKSEDYPFQEYYFSQKNKWDHYMWNECLQKCEKKLPDYFIRKESIYEDLIRIDYVRNHLLNTSGMLVDLCKKKMNVGKSRPLNEKNMTFEIAELIHSQYKLFFDYGGYEFDSWKNY